MKHVFYTVAPFTKRPFFLTTCLPIHHPSERVVSGGGGRGILEFVVLNPIGNRCAREGSLRSRPNRTHAKQRGPLQGHR